MSSHGNAFATQESVNSLQRGAVQAVQDKAFGSNQFDYFFILQVLIPKIA